MGPPRKGSNGKNKENREDKSWQKNGLKIAINR